MQRNKGHIRKGWFPFFSDFLFLHHHTYSGSILCLSLDNCCLGDILNRIRYVNAVYPFRELTNQSKDSIISFNPIALPIPFIMATNTNRRPFLLVNGLPSVQEDGSSSANTTPTATKPSTGLPVPAQAQQLTASPSRGDAKMNMLRRMRPPPFQYAWTFYHDKHNDSNSYEGRLTILLENIITLKSFWEAYNGLPLEALKMKDSVHFFKRGVKPVWEDPRNVKGGAWTFRVPKEKSEQTWKEFLLLAVGEQFADIIQPSKPHPSPLPPFLPTSDITHTNASFIRG